MKELHHLFHLHSNIIIKLIFYYFERFDLIVLLIKVQSVILFSILSFSRDHLKQFFLLCLNRIHLIVVRFDPRLY